MKRVQLAVLICFGCGCAAELINCGNKRGELFSPAGFLVSTCSVKDRIVPYVDLLTTKVLIVNYTAEVRELLIEFRPHLQALVESNFCEKLRGKLSKEDWDSLHFRDFSVDSFFDELMCHRRLNRSYVEGSRSSPPPLLAGASQESLDALVWLMDNAGRLQAAVERDYQALAKSQRGRRSHHRRRRRHHAHHDAVAAETSS